MDKLKFLEDFQHVKLGGADSFTDQLNCKYTVGLLVLCSAFITSFVYFGEPISCFTSKNYDGHQVNYINKVCWSTRTFYIPLRNGERQLSTDKDSHEEIVYYQWVPLMLVCQAVLFYLPRTIWKLLSKKSGVTMSSIVDAAIQCQHHSDQESSDKTIAFMTKYMARFLLDFSHGSCSFTSAVRGNYLVVVYLLIKLLYITNAIGQVFILNKFLTDNNGFYGFEVVQKIFAGLPWRSTLHRFPRVVICHYYLHEILETHKHSVQCAMPMNLYNEMVIIILWFWMIIVACITTASFLTWLITSLYLPFQDGYIRSRLVAMHGEIGTMDLKVFTRNRLRRDGCFIIRMVAKNANDLVATELISGLWNVYLEKENQSTDPKQDDEIAQAETIIMTAKSTAPTLPHASGSNQYATMVNEAAINNNDIKKHNAR